MKNSPYPSALADLAKRYDLRDIYVFGSRAEETVARVRGLSFAPAHPDSDLDMAVQGREGRTFTLQEKVEMAQALEDLFQVKRVDLVILSEAEPFLALEIVKGELLYSADPDRQAEDELYVLRRAGDLAYFERERRRMLLEGGTR
jgi:predicted nucleotidyltransferase